MKAELLRYRVAGKTSVLLALAACSVGKPPEPRVYVSNERDGTVSVIDPMANRVVGSIRIGARVRGVQVSPDGRTLYVARSTPIGRPFNAPDDRIVAVDVARREPRVSTEYDVGIDPERVAVSPDGRRLYVSNEDAGLATIFEIKPPRPHRIAALPAGVEPEGVRVSPDGRWVYVTGETSNSVSIIDAAQGRVASMLLVGARPRDAAFSADGRRAYVSAEVGRTLTVIDPRTQRILTTIPLTAPGNVKPCGVAVAPDGKRVFVALGRANLVAVVDAAGDSVLATIPVGRRPWGVALSPDGSRLYTANGLSNDVSVIDTRALREVARIRAGDGPWGVAVSPPLNR